MVSSTNSIVKFLLGRLRKPLNWSNIFYYWEKANCFPQLTNTCRSRSWWFLRRRCSSGKPDRLNRPELRPKRRSPDPSIPNLTFSLECQQKSKVKKRLFSFWKVKKKLKKASFALVSVRIMTSWFKTEPVKLFNTYKIKLIL